MQINVLNTDKQSSTSSRDFRIERWAYFNISPALGIYNSLPRIIIWPGHQNAPNSLECLLQRWLAHLQLAASVTCTAIEPCVKDLNLVIKPKPLASPPVARCINYRAIPALPAHCFQIDFIKRAIEQGTNRTVVILARYPSVGSIATHFVHWTILRTK